MNKLKIMIIMAAVLSLGVRPLSACMFCAAEGDPDVIALLARIEKEGAAMVPALRELAACSDPRHIQMRVHAIGALADFEDEESVPLFKSIVFEVIDQESEGTYGPWSPTAITRAAAARALSRLEVGGLNQRLISGWKELPLDRQREIPRLIGELKEGSAGLLADIVRDGRDRETVFQAVIQLRRCGTRAQAEALRERLRRWQREYAELISAGREDRYFSQQIDYTAKTIRGLEIRR